MWQPGITLEQLEKQAILEAVKFYGGSKEQAANALGISLRTIYNKFETYDAQSLKEKEDTELRKIEHQKQLEIMRGMNAPRETNGQETNRRLDVQPTPPIAEKRAMPMREQHKVQKVSSR